MEAQHKEALVHQRSAKKGVTHALPSVLTGTHAEGTPATMDPRNLSDAKPAEVNQQLLERLRHGMEDLAHLRGADAAENADPQLRAMAFQNLNQLRSQHPGAVGGSPARPPTGNGDGINFDTQSINSNRYNQSAIGEMNFDEVEQLAAKNEVRIEQARAKWLTSSQNIKTTVEAIRDARVDFQCKQFAQDSALRYPSYGRGLQPSINLNSFMVQERMAGVTKKRPDGANEHSPQANQLAKQRQRILSPRRKRFENHFDEYLEEKFVSKPLAELPEKKMKLLERPNFDAVTKGDQS